MRFTCCTTHYRTNRTGRPGFRDETAWERLACPAPDADHVLFIGRGSSYPGAEKGRERLLLVGIGSLPGAPVPVAPYQVQNKHDDDEHPQPDLQAGGNGGAQDAHVHQPLVYQPVVNVAYGRHGLVSLVYVLPRRTILLRDESADKANVGAKWRYLGVAVVPLCEFGPIAAGNPCRRGRRCGSPVSRRYPGEEGVPDSVGSRWIFSDQNVQGTFRPDPSPGNRRRAAASERL